MHEKRIPRELVFVEYKNTMEALRQIKQELRSYDYFRKIIGSGAINLIEIQYKAVYKNVTIMFKRPVPIPHRGTTCLFVCLDLIDDRGISLDIVGCIDYMKGRYVAC